MTHEKKEVKPSVESHMPVRYERDSMDSPYYYDDQGYSYQESHPRTQEEHHFIDDYDREHLYRDSVDRDAGYDDEVERERVHYPKDKDHVTYDDYAIS